MSGERKASIYDSIPNMDKNKAMKYVVKGLVIAILFGAIMMTSLSIAANADEWKTLADKENEEAYWDGDYGYNEYVERREDNERTQYWMDYQQVIVVNIARIGIYLGFLSIFVGLMGLVTNETLDEKTRWICLILASTIIVAMLFSLVINTTVFIQSA